MHQHLISGTWGESLAADHLIEKGYRIVERNWRFKRAEIDIIAWDGDILVFVEVKMRSGTGFGKPEEMVGSKKRRLIYDAAGAYMRQINYEWEVRFDIVSILGQEGVYAKLQHFPDAYYP